MSCPWVLHCFQSFYKAFPPSHNTLLHFLTKHKTARQSTSTSPQQLAKLSLMVQAVLTHFLFSFTIAIVFSISLEMDHCLDSNYLQNHLISECFFVFYSQLGDTGVYTCVATSPSGEALWKAYLAVEGTIFCVNKGKISNGTNAINLWLLQFFQICK